MFCCGFGVTACGVWSESTVLLHHVKVAVSYMFCNQLATHFSFKGLFYSARGREFRRQSDDTMNKIKIAFTTYLILIALIFTNNNWLIRINFLHCLSRHLFRKKVKSVSAVGEWTVAGVSRVLIYWSCVWGTEGKTLAIRCRSVTHKT